MLQLGRLEMNPQMNPMAAAIVGLATPRVPSPPQPTTTRQPAASVQAAATPLPMPAPAPAPAPAVQAPASVVIPAPPPGPRKKRRFWSELTTKEIAAGLDKNAVAVLPIASTEQHGPHLPLTTDTLILEGLMDEVAQYLPPEAPVFFLPTLSYGLSIEHSAFAGTLTLSPGTLRSVLTDLGTSVARAGVRKLVILDGHGGNPPVVNMAALELRAKERMIVAPVFAPKLFFQLGLLFPKEEMTHGIHGGAVETSIVMHLRPDLVRSKEVKNFVPETVTAHKEYPLLTSMMDGQIGFAWQTQDLHPEGACGDAGAADANKGRQMLMYAAERVAALLGEMQRLPPSAVDGRPAYPAAKAAAGASADGATSRPADPSRPQWEGLAGLNLAPSGTNTPSPSILQLAPTR
eukprot:tig00000042_g15608.t1